MQGGKGKVERRLMSFSLSGVPSLGRGRDELANTNTQHHCYPPFRPGEHTATTSLFGIIHIPCFPKQRAHKETHDTASPSFCQLQAVRAAADEESIQPLSLYFCFSHHTPRGVSNLWDCPFQGALG